MANVSVLLHLHFVAIVMKSDSLHSACQKYFYAERGSVDVELIVTSNRHRPLRNRILQGAGIGHTADNAIADQHAGRGKYSQLLTQLHTVG